jgi:hypothetical protein
MLLRTSAVPRVPLIASIASATEQSAPFKLGRKEGADIGDLDRDIPIDSSLFSRDGKIYMISIMLDADICSGKL